MKCRLTLLAVAACPALAGCTSPSTSLAPAPFDVLARDGSGIQLSAEGSSDGADTATLVGDSLLAHAADPRSDYAIMRLFLSVTSACSWQSEMEILIYDTDAVPVAIAGSENGPEVDMTVPVLSVASIDASGMLARVVASTVTRASNLVCEDGQWRISSPENMVLISWVPFTASFSLANFYLPMTEGGDLVIDLRRYPSRRLASHLLAGLVEGPRQSFEPVMASAIPAGTIVPSQGFDVVDGVARMELNAVVPVTEGARANLTWELTRTLTQVADVSQASASSSGDVLDAQGIPVPPTYSLDTLAGVGPDGVGIVSLPGLTSLISTIDASNPIVSPVDPSLIAWSGTGGVYAHRGGTSVMFLPG